MKISLTAAFSFHAFFLFSSAIFDEQLTPNMIAIVRFLDTNHRLFLEIVICDDSLTWAQPM